MSIEMYSDKELLTEVNLGNTSAFSILFDRYSEVLLRFIFKRIGCVSDSQDILQDIFISIWNKRNHIEVGDSLYPYLFKSAKYEVIDWFAKNQKQHKYMEQLVNMMPAEPSCDSTEEHILAKELSVTLEKEVDRMPATMRMVFRLSRGEHMSIQDIAAELSISEQTVKNNISLATSRLRLIIK